MITADPFKTCSLGIPSQSCAKAGGWPSTEKPSCLNYLITGRNEVVAKVIFLHLSVIHSLHRGGLPQCMLGYHPPGPDTPPTRHHPPGTDTPPTRHPPDETPPGSRPPWEQPSPLGADPPHQTPPPGADPPPREADSSIRSTSGRYASYWNAFLFVNSVAFCFRQEPSKSLYHRTLEENTFLVVYNFISPQ